MLSAALRGDDGGAKGGCLGGTSGGDDGGQEDKTNGDGSNVETGSEEAHLTHLLVPAVTAKGEDRASSQEGRRQLVAVSSSACAFCEISARIKACNMAKEGKFTSASSGERHHHVRTAVLEKYGAKVVLQRLEASL